MVLITRNDAAGNSVARLRSNRREDTEREEEDKAVARATIDDRHNTRAY